MKRKIAIMAALVFSLTSAVPVLAANYNQLTFEKEFITEKGKLLVSGEGDIHGFGCRCLPSGSMKIYIPEGMQGKKLYFQMLRRDAQGIQPLTGQDHLQITDREGWTEIPLLAEGVFAVDCDATENNISFLPGGGMVDKNGTAYALRLLGGTKYGDNALYGQEDRTVTNTMFYLYFNPSEYRKDYERTSHTVEVSAGSNIAVVNGEEMVWYGEVYRNENDILMIPLRSAAASLPKGVCKGVLWEEATNEAIIICGFRTYRFAEGERIYTENGTEIEGRAEVVRKDGVIYIPFETMEEFWDTGRTSHSKDGGKITGTVMAPKQEEGI